MKDKDLSPFRAFDRESWAALREDQALELTAAELEGLRSLGDPISLDEVRAVYLPVIRLLDLYIDAIEGLFDASRAFLGRRIEKGERKAPYIIGVAGSVAVGKSTTARLLRTLLGRKRKVDLVTTDGFLKPNATLTAEGLMTRKGFPESYDGRALIQFLSAVKRCERAEAPVYSHSSYDVEPDERLVVDCPDVLIFEGLNVLQPPDLRSGLPVVSDFFDFSIFIDAETEQIAQWYQSRFMRLRETAFLDERAFFHRYTKMTEAEAHAKAHELWTTINLVNLEENILPTRERARLVLKKGADHKVEQILLRRI